MQGTATPITSGEWEVIDIVKVTADSVWVGSPAHRTKWNYPRCDWAVPFPTQNSHSDQLFHRYYSSNEMDWKPGGRNVYRWGSSLSTLSRSCGLFSLTQLVCVCLCVCASGWPKTGRRRVSPVRYEEQTVCTIQPTSATTPPSIGWAAAVSHTCPPLICLSLYGKRFKILFSFFPQKGPGFPYHSLMDNKKNEGNPQMCNQI